MTDRSWGWLADPVIILAALAMTLAGTLSGLRGDQRDIDEVVYRSTLIAMQHGDGYYDAIVDAIDAKEGRIPSQVRSIRPPILAHVLAPFPEATWRWLALLPALGLCAAAGALAGPVQRSRQVAVVLTGVWLLVSLPLLYLHHELWGAPLVLAAALALRRDRDGLAAALCVLATVTRELFGLSLLVGLLMGRDRRPWALGIGVVGAAAALHVRLAGQVVESDGFDPPLRAYESYLSYVSPGSGVPSLLLGLAILLAAAVGFWLHRDRRELWFLALSLGPVLVLGAWGGRAYWALTWCGAASAAAGLAASGRTRSLERA